MKKITNREAQALKTKEKILRISLDMMREIGFDNVKISEICRKAEVSVGAFYHHFGSKEGIIIEGYSECDRYFDEIVVENLTPEGKIEQIVEYLRFQAKYAEDFGVDLLIQVYKSQLTDGTDFFLNMERALPKNLLKLIQDAQATNKLNNELLASDLMEELLIITRGCIYNWCQKRGTYDLQEKMTALVRHHLTCFQG